jgi:hypothetical protein
MECTYIWSFWVHIRRILECGKHNCIETEFCLRISHMPSRNALVLCIVTIWVYRRKPIVEIICCMVRGRKLHNKTDGTTSNRSITAARPCRCDSTSTQKSIQTLICRFPCGGSQTCSLRAGLTHARILGFRFTQLCRI